MENSYWYKLIEDRVLVQKKTGYTLPFLIGAQKVANVENPIGVKELLEEMKNYHKKITIKYCSQTREYIVKRSDKFSIPIPDELFFGNLTINTTHDFLQGIEDFENIKDACEAIYSKRIDKGHFSKIVRGHDNDWQEFQDEEKYIIKRVLNVK